MRDHAYVVNVDGAVVDDGEYLLIERGEDKAHASGLLAFPGGRMEGTGRDAPLEQTAARELYEEVGVTVGAVEYVCSSTFESDEGARCLNVVTLCEQVGGEAHPRADDEVAAVHWLTPDQVRAHDDAPPFLVEYVERVEQVRRER
jgi:8-oxo-dGTP diphosphatase